MTLKIAGVTADEYGALVELDSRIGPAIVGTEVFALHASWAPILDRLATRGLVESYPENGTLADDPGRTCYELAEAGVRVLVKVAQVKRELATW